MQKEEQDNKEKQNSSDSSDEIVKNHIQNKRIVNEAGNVVQVRRIIHREHKSDYVVNPKKSDDVFSADQNEI